MRLLSADNIRWRHHLRWGRKWTVASGASNDDRKTDGRRAAAGDRVCCTRRDSTILQNNSFHSTTVFLANRFGRMSWPGLTFKAFSASTELGSPAFYCGVWRRIFTVYNSHSVVYLLWRNILQRQKLYHCTIANSVKITHSVWPAISIYYISESKQAEGTSSLENTN